MHVCAVLLGYFARSGFSRAAEPGLKCGPVRAGLRSRTLSGPGTQRCTCAISFEFNKSHLRDERLDKFLTMVLPIISCYLPELLNHDALI